MSQSLHKLFKQKKCNSLVHAVIKRDKRGEVTWPAARKRVNNNLLKQLFCENLKPISFLQMFFFKIVFDKICHAIEWKGVDGTKTWIDCIEKCIFCTIYFPFSHDGVSCIITASPGPISRHPVQPEAAEADPIAALSTISARQAHCAITKIYYFSPHQHLDQWSHNNNTYRDGWWWEPFGTSFFIYIPPKYLRSMKCSNNKNSRNPS